MAIWVHSDTVTLEPKLGGVCPFCSGPLCLLVEEPHEEIEYFPSDGVYSWRVSSCSSCGWWHCVEPHFRSHHSVVYSHARSASACLKHIDPTDQETPISEIRAFAERNWERRFEIHPRLMEELVADVYRNLGYTVELRAFQKDGGVDIYLLGDGTSRTGVQVKRTKNPISVEQIRSFTGALLLRGVASGVYVTTSRFTSPSEDEALVSGEKGIPIELWDSGRLLDYLDIQRSPPPSSFPEWKDQVGTIKLVDDGVKLAHIATD